MNTAMRLIILIPGGFILVVIGVLGLGFGGFTVGSFALAIALIASPIALIAWAILDHRRRHSALLKTKVNK